MAPLESPTSLAARGERVVPELRRGTFAGSGSRFFGMLLTGTLLYLPTLGFYRFWLLTDLRRYLWAHTRIGDDGFEYTGTPRELLIGFLIAVGVLAPIYAIYFGIGVELERAKAFASVPLFLILYVLGRYAMFRSRRYRATRTVFRGVRFWMTGSGWAYAARCAGWDLLTILTVGLALPWRMAALERYRMRNTWYGDLQGVFVGTGWSLFKRGILLWAILAVGLAAAIAGPIVAGASIAAGGGGSQVGETIAAVLGLFMLACLPAYPLFRAVVLRWELQGMRFGEIAVVPFLRKRQIVWCYIKAALASIAYIALWGALAGVIAVASGLSLERLERLGRADFTQQIGFMVAVGAIYLLFLLGASVIKRYFVDFGTWRAIAGTVALGNAGLLDRVSAAGGPAGSLGEGLADALDVGGL